MPRDTTPNFEPHLAQGADGNWYVRMKTAPGQYDVLSDFTVVKKLASRDLRRIRREMAEVWWNSEHAKARGEQ